MLFRHPNIAFFSVCFNKWGSLRLIFECLKTVFLSVLEEKCIEKKLLKMWFYLLGTYVIFFYVSFKQVIDIRHNNVYIHNFRVILRPLRVILEESCWGQKFLKIWFCVGIVNHFVLLKHSIFYGLIDCQLIFKCFHGGNQTTQRILTYTIGKSIVMCILFYVHTPVSLTSVHPTG